jgi:hypothetical protein
MVNRVLALLLLLLPLPLPHAAIKQAAVQPSSIFADISSPSSRVPTNQPFMLELRGGMTVTGSTGLQLMGSVSGGCSLQLQIANPDKPGEALEMQRQCSSCMIPAKAWQTGSSSAFVELLQLKQ